MAPGKPWTTPKPNGYVESFNGKLCDELLDQEIVKTLLESEFLIERWRIEYNNFGKSSLGYRPPAPKARQPVPVMV